MERERGPYYRQTKTLSAKTNVEGFALPPNTVVRPRRVAASVSMKQRPAVQPQLIAAIPMTAVQAASGSIANIPGVTAVQAADPTKVPKVFTKIDMTLPGTPERHGSRAYKVPKVKSRARKVVGRTMAGTMALFVLLGGGLGAQAWLKLNKSFSGSSETVAALRVEADKVDPNALKGEGSGRINILMLGKGGAVHPGG